MSFLLDGFQAVTWQQGVMYLVGLALIYLAIQKDYEPALLLPMGFGAILVNLPSSGVLNQMVEGIGESQGIIQWLFETTIEASEALPLLLFIGIGAMIDFGPLLSNPKMLLFGAADGPTSILVSQVLHSSYVGPIAVAAYSYMALVPIIQPFAIKLVTTKKERRIRMPYNPKNVSRTLRICFPILVTIIAGVMFAKLLNLFSKKKVNPMVGAAGISAFPMSARVIQKMGLEADSQNHLLMHAVGANVAGQIASVLAGGMILNLVPQLLK